MQSGMAIAMVLACASSAAADHALTAAGGDEAAAGKHLVYAELLGKGGAYGVGYEYSLRPRLAIGGAASYAVIRDQQLLTLAPYLHATILRGARHALFGELGAMIVHSRIPSPVPDWNGMSSSGAGAFGSLGWERAAQHLVLRASATLVVGEGGVAPWLGFAIGYRP